MSVTFADERPSYSTVKNWVARFTTGYLSTENKEHSGRPTETLAIS
jgi:transposase